MASLRDELNKEIAEFRAMKAEEAGAGDDLFTEEEIAQAQPVPVPSPLMARQAPPAAPRTLEQTTQDVFRLDPNLQRSTLLPLARVPEGQTGMFGTGVVPAVPQIGVDLLQGMTLPRYAMEGNPYTMADVTRMALDYSPGPRGMRPTRRQVIKGAPTRQALQGRARAALDEADRTGMLFSRETMNNLVGKIGDDAQKQGVRSRRLFPDATGALKEWQTRFGDASEWGLFDLGDLRTMRREAGIVASSMKPDEARVGVRMIDALDDFVDNLKPDDVVTGGDPINVGNQLKQFRALWHRQAKSRTIEEAIDRANIAASGVESGLRNEFRAILRNPKRSRGFTADEKNMMRRIVKGDAVQNAVRLLQHFGLPVDQRRAMLGSTIGATLGGGLGSAAGDGPGAAMGALGALAAGTGAGALASRRMAENVDMLNALVLSGGNLPQAGSAIGRLLRRSAGPLVGTQVPQSPPKRWY